MRNRIVLTGTYCSKNKGDAAMRIAAADAIREMIPESQVSILTPFPEIDRYAYNGDPIVQCSRREPAKAIRLICCALMRSLAKRAGIGMRRIPCSEEMRSYLDADLIVDLSGDGITEEYGLKCALSHFVPVVVGLILGKPVFLCAQTIGPLNRTRLLSKQILNRVSVISAREQGSMNYLRQCGLTKPELCMTADMAFLLKPCSPQQARSVLQLEGIGDTRPLVGMSVSRLHGHTLEGGPKCPTYGEFVNIMAAMADGIVEKLGADVVLVSHTTGPGTTRDDRVSAEEVRKASKNADRIHFVRGDYSPGELKGLIGRMQLFVGLRMHSNIAALSMCVPTITIAYGPKAPGIMSLSGQADRTIDLHELSENRLFSMIESAWRDRQKIRTELESTMPRIKELSMQNIEIIAELLERKSKVGARSTTSATQQDSKVPIADLSKRKVSKV